MTIELQQMFGLRNITWRWDRNSPRRRPSDGLFIKIGGNELEDGKKNWWTEKKKGEQERLQTYSRNAAVSNCERFSLSSNIGQKEKKCIFCHWCTWRMMCATGLLAVRSWFADEQTLWNRENWTDTIMTLDRKRSVRGSVRSRGSSTASSTDRTEKLKDCCRQFVAFMFTQVRILRSCRRKHNVSNTLFFLLLWSF